MAELNNTGATASQTTVGTVGTHKVENGAVVAGPQMNKATVSQRLSKVMASNYPLDTLLRNIGSGKTKSDKYDFYSIVSRGTQAVVKTGASATTANQVIELALESGCHCLSKDGCVLLTKYNVSYDDTNSYWEATAVATGVIVPNNPLILHIVSIDYGSKKIKVVGINAQKFTIATDDVLYRMASAKDQDAAMSDDPMATPTKDSNYCQRNLCTISENAFQALQEKEVAYGLAEFKEQALLDFRFQNEMNAIFGTSYYGGGENFVDPQANKRKLFSRGLLNFDILKMQQGSTETVEKFLNKAMEAIFSCNNGSESRLFLYGPGVATKLADGGAFQKQLEAGKTEVKWGITWKVIESNFGTLLGIMHPGLGLVGPYSNCAIVIDPANIRRINQLDLQTNNLDLKSAGIRNSKDITLDESWTLEVTNPRTHALLAFK